MIIYRVNKRTKIICVIFTIIVILSAILVFSEIKTPVILKLFGLIGPVIAIGGSYGLAKMKITLTDEKFELFTVNTLPIFWGKGIIKEISSLKWGEIAALETNYILYPETPTVILKPRANVNKKRIEFIMAGLPLNLLKDIISHLLPDAKIYLYPYLKRKLEGKQTWFYREKMSQ